MAALLATLGPLAPAAAQDVVRAADMAGLRPGMTLAEARAQLAAHGGQIPDNEHPTMHNNFLDGPNPQIFVKTFDTGDFAQQAGLYFRTATGILHVFPRDPEGDIRDPGNLILYDIELRGQMPGAWRDGLSPSGDEYVRQAGERFGSFASNTHGAGDPERAACLEALVQVYNRTHERAVWASIGGDTPFEQRPELVERGRACGALAVADLTEVDGRVQAVALRRIDFVLAEQAYENLAQVVGHEAGMAATLAEQRSGAQARATAEQ
jgi:hypothetical protein